MQHQTLIFLLTFGDFSLTCYPDIVNYFVYSQSKYQRSAGDVIKKKQILNIIKDAVKPNNLSSLEMFGGTLELTNQWARYLLKKLDRHKCKGTTEKIDNSHLSF